MFTTDPKGELLAKFYYSATVRGMEVVQFNLMNPNLTNVFNPLANAIQEFRRSNKNKGTALIDSIVDTLFPDNGEIWNPAAGNMFRRAVYLLFDYYIEQEKYIRYLGYDEEMDFQLVGSTEANSLQGKISNESPVGKALIGAKQGDVVDVELADGDIMQYKVLKIERNI